MSPVQLSIIYLPSRINGTYCIVIADLTERIRSDEALRQANENLEVKIRERTKDLTESEARYRSSS